MNIFKELDEIFEEVKDEELSGYVELPDGEYLVKLAGAELTKSKSDKPMVVTAFEVDYGEHKGVIHKVFHVLTGNDIQKTRNAVNRFAMFAKSCGASTTGGIQGTVASLEGLKGERRKLVKKTSDNGWTNNDISE